MSPAIDWKMYAFMCARSILANVFEFKDDDATVVWDLSGSYRRKRAYPEYKERPKLDKNTPEGRKEVMELEAYIKARDWLHANLPRMSIRSIQEKGIEADDIAYWLIMEKFPSQNIGLEKTNYFCTSDLDWCQFITEYWWWYNPMKRVKDENGVSISASKEEKIFDYKDFIETYGTRKRFVMRKALLGDTSDNIPKSYLMGEKNVDKYVDKLLNRESIVDDSAVSKYLQEFVRSGQLTKNLELIMFGLLGRSERKRLHISYDESNKKVSKPVLVDWIAMGAEIDSTQFLAFGDYLNFT